MKRENKLGEEGEKWRKERVLSLESSHMKAQREEVEPPTESACALFDGHNAEVPSRASKAHLSVSAVVSVAPMDYPHFPVSA
jgi:hypothetical protein